MVLGCFACLPAGTWGFFGHRSINRLAVFTLPAPLITFYKQHIEYLTEHAVDPDKRRYSVPEEAARHYLDADHYEHAVPLDTVRLSWKKACEVYGEDSLKAYGILPWHLGMVMYRLTEAFRSRDRQRILRLSADLGHYVGDCHVPLHTTENYNGQLTGQEGIHGFWESRLPELFSGDYDFFTGRAVYVEDVQQLAWEAFGESVAARDSVLRFERLLNERFPQDRKYGFEDRGTLTARVYSYEYSRAYHDMLSGMVERRMQAAVHRLGCLWYTAWINAGQPDLQLLPEGTPDPVDTSGQVKGGEGGGVMGVDGG